MEKNYPAVRRPLNISIFVLTIKQVADLTGVQEDLIEKFISLGLIDPLGKNQNGEWVFSKDVIPLIYKIMRLHNDLEINFAGIGVVLELLERIEALEKRIKELEAIIENTLRRETHGS